MCGILITWYIGRNNNGPIGADNPVRGEAVNTRVVKLLPVEAKDDHRVPDRKKENSGEVKGVNSKQQPKVRIREDGRTVLRYVENSFLMQKA